MNPLAVWAFTTVLIAGMISIGAIIGLLAGLWKAWWLFPAWAWFLVPLGVPQISLIGFMGLSVFINAVRPAAPNKKGEKDDWSNIMIGWVIGPVFSWFFLWFIHRWLA